MTIVEVRDAHKRFRNTRALDGVHLMIQSGEILGIAGPNGAGKSTLTRALSGEERLDSGEILIDGEVLPESRIGELVAVVHQEPQVWLNLTVAQNLMVGNEDTRFGLPSTTQDQHRVLERIGIDHLSDTLLGECSLAVRQRVEIARALVRDARVILFDEPNSALTDEESASLFEFMHELANSGHVIALITHRLAELVTHCGRVVVIRDGRVATELSGEALTETAIASELVAGETKGGGHKKKAHVAMVDEESLVLTNKWSDAQGSFRDVALKVAPREIVAIVGVEGSGGREIVSALGGMRPSHGEVRVAGMTNENDRTSKIAYLSANRTEMLYHNLTVADNLVARLGNPKIANKFGLLRRRNIRTTAVQAVNQYSVRTDGVEQMLTSLSGGNQQKVAIAAAMISNPSLLLVEEPTRGVDVGSKREIYQMLREYADEGRAVIAFCTEAPEAYELADSVIVVQRGLCLETLKPIAFPDVQSFASALAELELIDVAEHSSSNSAVSNASITSNERTDLA
ncbi:MAG TPA: sugar ABC transporter ATP-binding protein [Candidatus Nanopelagicaceae bacterium]|nr:sugar ABC transporter ATP-binding protein [Candidatus Nanopelagicaceae bacterium]